MSGPEAVTDLRSHVEPFRRLAEELVDAFAAWGESGDDGLWTEDRLSELARRAHGIQWAGVEPYRRYCERRGIGAEDVRDWRDAPPVPTAAFREVELHVREMGEPKVVFRTSGTTRGGARRGAHPIVAPELYRASLLAGFRRFVLEPDQVPLRFVSLIPPLAVAADSSLGWMCEAVIEAFGGPGSLATAGPGGLDWDALERFIERAIAESVPVCILATTLAADEWSRRLEERAARLELPAGSRLMDTGGAKGRAGLDRADVLTRLGATLGIGPAAVVNEFGMTELCSQRYGRAPDWRLQAPPWLRTRALDPVTLAELPEGEAGVLCHYDLANLGSVCAVLTEDMGRVRDGAVEWIGRSEGAPPRGCSLATAELLEAQAVNVEPDARRGDRV